MFVISDKMTSVVKAIATKKPLGRGYGWQRNKKNIALYPEFAEQQANVDGNLTSIEVNILERKNFWNNNNNNNYNNNIGFAFRMIWRIIHISEGVIQRGRIILSLIQ